MTHTIQYNTTYNTEIMKYPLIQSYNDMRTKHVRYITHSAFEINIQYSNKIFQLGCYSLNQAAKFLDFHWLINDIWPRRKDS